MDHTKPPSWVHKRDGRLVPFESDRISRALFAAAEEIGLADAFLARELADSVVFFLSQDADENPPTTTQIADLVVKVVRELGQPALAAAFAAGASRKPRGAGPGRRADTSEQEVVFRFSPGSSPNEVLAACARQYGMAAVFSRDLAAVQNDDLITLLGVESPRELAGCVWAWPTSGQGLAEALDEVRQQTAHRVALDGMEDALSPEPSTASLIREFALGLRAAGLTAIVNLNSAEPPSWADDHSAGPLFAGMRAALAPEQRAVRADDLADQVLSNSLLRGRMRLDWHVNENDVQPARRERLMRMVRKALDGSPVAFAFDRPRQTVALAEGLDRLHSAVLIPVVLHLPRLLDATRGGDADLFVQKLGSLARLALSAAVQKRDFLRRHRPDLGRGFLLERARLVVTPQGLDAVARRVRDRSLFDGGAGLDFARRVVQRIQEVLRQDGEACRMMTCLDGLPGDDPLPEVSAASFKVEFRSAGALHSLAEGGTAVVNVKPDTPAEQVADWVAWVWLRTDLVRLRFESASAKRR